MSSFRNWIHSAIVASLAKNRIISVRDKSWVLKAANKLENTPIIYSGWSIPFLSSIPATETRNSRNTSLWTPTASPLPTRR
jgi:hypothetical protein